MNNGKNTNAARALAMGVVAALVIVGMAGTGLGSAASATLTWNGMTRDKVSSGSNPNPDYNPDGYFTMNIDLGVETKTIDYIILKSVDAIGNPTGHVWDTDPNNDYWILAVEQPAGTRLNPTDTLIRKTISGNTAIELYAANSGRFVLGNYFKATIRFTDGTLIDATAPIVELPMEFPANLKWNGMTIDKVGTGGNPNPDKNPDGYFTMNIDLGVETKTIDYIILKSVDAIGNPTGHVWDTDPNNDYWILAVEQPAGTRLNPTDTLIRKTISGNTAIELYAANSGRFVLGNYFKATVRFTDGTLIDATTPIEEISQQATPIHSPTSNPKQTSSTPPQTYTSQPSIVSDTSPPSISLSKQTVDLNKNGQLDEGEKLVITYGANDENGVKSIKVLLDGNLIELRNNEGTYSVTTDSLSVGSHSIVVEATDSKGNRNSEELKINAARAGPSVYFQKSRYEVTEGEEVNVVLSAVNPIGNPKMEALLIIKPPGNGVSITESWCKGLEGMCTGKYEIEAGDSVRSNSVNMRAERAGEYQIDSEVYYQYEGGQRSPTRYETLTLVVKPKQVTSGDAQSIPRTPGFGVILAISGLLLTILLRKRRIS